MSFVFEGECPPPSPQQPVLQDSLLNELLKPASSHPLPNIYQRHPHYKNYIRWLEYCIQNGVRDINQIRELEAEHRLTIDCLPGMLGLIRSDYEELVDLLRSNDGSKESLMSIASFCRDYAHSAIAIGLTFVQFIQRAIESCESFNKVYHAVLALNEMLSYPGTIFSRGPYTHSLPDSAIKVVSFMDLLWPHLVFIFYLVYRATNLLVEKDKLVDLLDFWVSKDLLSRSQFDSIRSTMMNERLKLPEPPTPALVPPCINLRPRLSTSSETHGGSKPALTSAASHPPPVSLGALETLTVGRMADIAKARLRLGAERYEPLDLNMNPVLVNLPGDVSRPDTIVRCPRILF